MPAAAADADDSCYYFMPAAIRATCLSLLRQHALLLSDDAAILRLRLHYCRYRSRRLIVRCRMLMLAAIISSFTPLFFFFFALRFQDDILPCRHYATAARRYADSRLLMLRLMMMPMPAATPFEDADTADASLFYAATIVAAYGRHTLLFSICQLLL